MKERDRQTVKTAKEFGRSLLTRDLVIIIECLDKQLTEVKEAGEPFASAYYAMVGGFPNDPDLIKTGVTFDIPVQPEKQVLIVKQEVFRRLAQAMKEVKDE